MKVLVVVCAVVAGCLADYPSLGYGYSAISPLTGYSSAVAPFSYAYSAPIYSITPYAAPLAVKSQYHAQNELGIAQYGHDEPGQSHHAVQDAAGNKFGSFSYVDHHGGVHFTTYAADDGGYRVVSNDVPVGPAAPVPVLHRRKRQAWNGPPANIQVSPTGHLRDTPEVDAAKRAHNAEVIRLSRGPQAQQPSWDQGAQPNWQSQAAPLSWSQPRSGSWSQQAASSTAPAAQWNPPQSAQVAQTYSSWNKPQSVQSNQWDQTAALAARWNEPQSVQSNQWGQTQAPAARWNGPQSVIPAVNQGGHISDTPEVSQAKAAFQQEYMKLAKAAAEAPETPNSAPFQGEDDGQYREDPSWSQNQQWSQGQQWNSNAGYRSLPPSQAAAPSWPSAQAAAPSWQTNTLAQQSATPNQVWNAEAQSKAYSSSWNQQPQTVPASPSWAASQTQPQLYSQQPQVPQWGQSRALEQSASPWGQSGGIQDTPEVAAAKAAHYKALADAQRAQRSAQ